MAEADARSNFDIPGTQPTGRRLPGSARWVMGAADQARALMRLVGGPIETGMQEPSKSMPHVGS
ncbi:MAG TPA: hypothetical protein VFQ48_07810, partial [Pseudonocardiaceae bacterium]|nr:hypothetical protein [Pseudonocardiaceae bacterium]